MDYPLSKRTAKPSGAKIVALRRRRGWSQQRLADQAGLESKRTISSAEKGEAKYLSTLEAIAKALDVSVEEIILHDDPAVIHDSGTLDPPALFPKSTGPELVYVLGQLSYDLVNEPRLDAFAQNMAGHFGTPISDRTCVFDPIRLLDYLDTHPWDAAAIEWTLSVDATPIYAIRPEGPFAADAYKELRQFLREHVAEGVERISVPGRLAGSVALMRGRVVPILVPELRGMYSWTTQALVDAVVGPHPPTEAAMQDKVEYHRKRAGVQDFLLRVYNEMRNPGLTPHDRALNFAATNAFQANKIYESVLKEKDRMELDSIKVTRSPICEPPSDCWEVELSFFFPERQVQTVRKVYRFTVDVGDVVPVTVGLVRSWFTR